ncbi:type IV pilin [Candidatus Pacearchaeota archaeon]|nr:type IV pilin [Candidatus Pacearchaeota archaeon]
MNNKRALSQTIATVLMILQIIVAIAVISGLIFNIVKGSEPEMSFEKRISQFEIKDVNLWMTGGASIKVKSNSMAEGMDSLKIIFYDKNRDSYDVVISDPDRIPNLHETKAIVLTVDEIPINNSEIEKISVYPTDGKNYGLESKEPESFIQRDSFDNRILDAPPEAISWWRFDKTTKDHIGNNHGLLQDDAVVTEDGELLLDGDGDWIDIGHHDNLDIKDNDWTISVWVNPERLTSSQYIVSKRDITTFANGQYSIFLYENNFRALLFDTFPKNANGQEDMQIDKWVYLTAVYKKADGLKTYINGNFDTETPISSASYSILENIPLQIGCVNQAQCFQGLIDDVVIFKKALSGSEIRAIYSNQMKS